LPNLVVSSIQLIFTSLRVRLADIPFIIAFLEVNLSLVKVFQLELFLHFEASRVMHKQDPLHKSKYKDLILPAEICLHPELTTLLKAPLFS